MRRRTFLGAVAGASAATAGCAQLSETVDRATEGSRIDNLGGTGHPWDGDPIVVAPAYEDGQRRENFPELIEASATFWEENDEAYLDYEVEYDLRPDADDPDVRVVLVSEVTSCDRHGGEYQVVGCAPLIEGAAPDTARVEIKSGFSDGLMRTTITHELGHTLGLGHDDEPTEIMSGNPADRLPNYETRRAIHEAYVSGVGSVNDGHEHRSEAQTSWEEERWTDARDAYAKAEAAYGSAVESFESALGDADSLGVAAAVEICRSARDFADEHEAGAGAMREAAAAAAADEDRTANDHIQTAREHYERGKEHDVSHSDDLATALALK